MHEINAVVSVNAPPDIVFSVLKDMERYPTFMHYVRSVEVKKMSDGEYISRWRIDVEGADVEWEERDIYNEKKMEMLFTMLSGDYGNYYGKWALNCAGKSKTIVSIDVFVDWHIPLFEQVIGPILEQKMRRVVRGMVAAIKLYSQKVFQESVKK
jgi:ribosome-associated toxin RatA of RatAB toxin-antitoxin module